MKLNPRNPTLHEQSLTYIQTIKNYLQLALANDKQILLHYLRFGTGDYKQRVDVFEALFKKLNLTYDDVFSVFPKQNIERLIMHPDLRRQRATGMAVYETDNVDRMAEHLHVLMGLNHPRLDTLDTFRHGMRDCGQQHPDATIYVSPQPKLIDIKTRPLTNFSDKTLCYSTHLRDDMFYSGGKLLKVTDYYTLVKKGSFNRVTAVDGSTHMDHVLKQKIISLFDQGLDIINSNTDPALVVHQLNSLNLQIYLLHPPEERFNFPIVNVYPDLPMKIDLNIKTIEKFQNSKKFFIDTNERDQFTADLTTLEFHPSDRRILKNTSFLTKEVADKIKDYD